MKELQEIASAWEAIRDRRRAAALATLVSVDGSAYRRPGARMLIGPDGTTVGSVSGGCLEADVVERAQQVMASGAPRVITYDTTDEGDILFGVGLGCKGIVQVLIERLSTDDSAAIILPNNLLRRRGTGVLATVYASEETTGLHIGDRLLLTEAGQTSGSFSLATEARRVLEMGTSASRTVTIGGGRADVFFEVLRPALPLVVFGAGQDAQPLVRLAREMGWHVTVADHRSAFATSERFPQADAVLISPQAGLPETLRLDAHTAAVLMTHNYRHDRAIVAALLESPVRYVGVLGPKRRTEALLAELREDGLTLTDAFLSRLHSPVGLDIGAETPEQIALAIVSEIQAALASRTGGFLRDRGGPIYPPAVAETPRAAPNLERPSCPISA